MVGFHQYIYILGRQRIKGFLLVLRQRLLTIHDERKVYVLDLKAHEGIIPFGGSSKEQIIAMAGKIGNTTRNIAIYDRDSRTVVWELA